MKVYIKFHGLYTMFYIHVKTKSSSDLNGDEQYLTFFFLSVFPLEFKGGLLGCAKRRQELHT